MESQRVSSRASRISSVDVLRGLVMVIMALDHARDFFHLQGFTGNPTDLATTTGAMFMTRWITHFCAPVFVFLAGTGAYFQRARGKSIAELSRFLWTRGLVLVVMELTLVRFAWTFDTGLHFIVFQVIWTIGVCMIVLSQLIRLRLRTIAIIGAVIVLGHNALDGIAAPHGSVWEYVWALVHVQSFFMFGTDTRVAVFYPVLPWIGLTALGYVFGRVFDADVTPARRRSMLAWIGGGSIALFVVLRTWNIYGEMHPWGVQSSGLFSVLSFINTTKYPPSLLYLLMTIGPAMLFLRAFDGGVPKFMRPLITFGRVPMFYYLAHLYLIHIGAVAAMYATGFTTDAIFGALTAGPRPTPVGYGFDLTAVYAAWLLAVIALYPVCAWYDRYKSAHRDKVWLSYL